MIKKPKSGKKSTPPVQLPKTKRTKEKNTFYTERRDQEGFYRTFFREAEGKTVESIEHSRDDAEGVWSLTVRFTDQTLFEFDIDARPRVRATYMRDEEGNLEVLGKYGRKTVCDW